MKIHATAGIVADGADRLRKILPSKPQSTEASGENMVRRIARVIRRVLCLPSIPERRLNDEGPSPCSLFGSQAEYHKTKQTDKP
jgi:hypothetical protein